MSNGTVTVKSYDELEYRDDFMFGVTMSDAQLCRDVLRCLTGQEVGELQYIQSQKELRIMSDGKPIRLDIYTKDDDTVYDAEMQQLGHKSVRSLELPKRTRFYQALIDNDHMHRKENYKNIPETKIIFICTFDPFGMGFSKYVFRERCDEEFGLVLGDGTEKHFYNCKYQGDDISDELRNFFDYVQTGRASDDLTRRIEDAVTKAKLNEEWRSTYMKERILIMDAKEEGREEGLVLGREEERVNTERERRRADEAEAKIKELEERLAVLTQNK